MKGNEKSRKRYPAIWRCRKMPLITMNLVITGEIEYLDTYGKMFDDGFRLMKISKDAIPAKSGFICDCGDWVLDNDYFHEVLEWMK